MFKNTFKVHALTEEEEPEENDEIFNRQEAMNVILERSLEEKVNKSEW